MSLSPREMLARLVAFPSVSTISNLDIIGFCRDWLNSHGVESHLVMSPEGDKANLYATIGPRVEGGIVLRAIRMWCRSRARTGPGIPGRSQSKTDVSTAAARPT